MPDSSSPTESPSFELRDIEPRLWRLGPSRSSNVYYPFDEVFLSYFIAGATLDAEGNADLQLNLSVLDETGRGFSAEPETIRGRLVLGGGIAPGQATALLSSNAKPGAYRLTVEVRDNLAGRSAGFSHPIVLRPEAFAIVSTKFSLDPEGRIPSPCGGLVGQTLHYNFKLIGFSRSTMRVDASMTMVVLDESGLPTMPVPPRFAIQSSDPRVVPAAEYLEFRGQLLLNRPGRFVLRFDVRDEIDGKTTSSAFPLVVATV